MVCAWRVYRRLLVLSTNRLQATSLRPVYNSPMSPETILDLVGNTPLVELRHMAPKPGIRILAKLEGQNPSGSVKDRIVKAMVEAAEQRGDLKPGHTIVEASTGNTAISLAMIGKQKGYGVRLAIPKGVTPSIADILQAYGAEVTWCESHAGMKGAVEVARQIAEADGSYCLGQFTDPTNVETHYRTTGEEIALEIPDLDVFVAGIGTGGTLMGVGRRLRESNPGVRVIGVEPQMGERLQGLRSLAEGYVPPLLNLEALDGRFLVSSAQAITATEAIIEKEGIMAGISSGAVLHTAQRVAQRMEQGTIVVMFADGGWKYLPARPWSAAREESATLDDTHWW